MCSRVQSRIIFSYLCFCKENYFDAPGFIFRQFLKKQYNDTIVAMWALYAIIAALLWGVDYALTEKVLQSVRFPILLSIELFFGFLTMLGVAIFSGSYKSDWTGLFSSNRTILFVIAIVVTF